ncbi:MAG: hypothetical protein F7C34_03015 [Desulfurococcales archaeon]|nr:hypothetical protein [Desulfurococcales archaeon]
MPRFAVAGLGRIGLISLLLLRRLGYEAFGISITLESVEAARRLGLEAYPGDIVANPRLIDKYGGADVVLLALPGAVGFEGLKGLVAAGYNVVDVSFFREDPEEIRPVAEKMGVTAVVDAGVAPGLSNLLSARALHETGAENIYVFVGSISRSEKIPLGIVPVWSLEDLLDEYVRPARFLWEGRRAEVMPLEAPPGFLYVEAVGTLEYVPTDGLRSLLKTLSGKVRTMVEYTLRWPGHYDIMRLLYRVGMLSDRPHSVEGCPVKPRLCLAKVLEHNLPVEDDLVVLKVVGVKGEDCIVYNSVVTPSNGISAVSLSTSSFQVGTALLVAEGQLPKGVVYPEEIVWNRQAVRRLIRFVEEQGVVVAENRLQVEECFKPSPPPRLL